MMNRIYESKPLTKKLKNTLKRKKGKSKKKLQCCVENCPSREPCFLAFLRFPQDTRKREMWLNAIPKESWVVDHLTTICMKHFPEYAPFLNIETLSDDEISEDMIPSVFPSPYPGQFRENRYTGIDSAMFLVSPFYELPQIFDDLKKRTINIDDFIFDFNQFKTQWNTKLTDEITKYNWMMHENIQGLLFFKLRESSCPVGIKVAIQIYRNMQTDITLGNFLMDPLDYAGYVPVNGCITHWNQIKKLLNDYGLEELKITPVRNLISS